MLSSVTKRMGGGEGTQGIYGTLTPESVYLLAHLIKTHCPLGKGAYLVDAGSGIGVLLTRLGFLLHPHKVTMRGIEVDEVKHIKAQDIRQQLFQMGLDHQTPELRDLLANGLPNAPEFDRCDIAAAEELKATHVVAFWEGWSPASKQALGKACSEGKRLQFIIIIQRTRKHLLLDLQDDFAFPALQLLHDHAVHMSGKRQTFRAYCFLKV